MPSYRMILAYDGTEFWGSQIQPRRRTVQGELERVLAEIAGEPVRTTFGGRTDRGVHAVGQVVAVDLRSWRNTAVELQRALAARLPCDVAAYDLVGCLDTFHPRFDAHWREYRYWVAPGVVSPFVQRYGWTPRAETDVGAMAAAAEWLVGTYDFASFAGGGEGVPWSERARRPQGTTRTIFRCDCRPETVRVGPGTDRRVGVIQIAVAADSFLPRMVRNIVGALVEVGQGRREPGWIAEVLAKRDRRYGSVLAPAQGLTLHHIAYDMFHFDRSESDDTGAGARKPKERQHGAAHVVAEAG